MRVFSLWLVLLLLTSCNSEKTELVAVKNTPDENGAIAAIKSINQAQQDFIRRNRRYALTYDELISARLLNEKPSSEKLGYDISMRPRPDAEAYSIFATPTDAATPARHFFTDQTGVIRAEQGRAATAESPQV